MPELKVAPWNSTVNGRNPNPNRSAIDWFNGWKDLGFTNRRVQTDGRKDNPWGMGEYLHVPVLGKSSDHRFYRVRCRYHPGGKYRGKKVRSVSVVKIKSEWYWRIECKQTGAT